MKTIHAKLRGKLPRNYRIAKVPLACDLCGQEIGQGELYQIAKGLYYHPGDVECIRVVIEGRALK